MSNPILKYCDNKHIYDASIHDECPYCKQLRREIEILETSLQSSNRRMKVKQSGLDEDDQTILLDGGIDNDLERERNDSNSSQYLSEKSEKRVIGWLVCTTFRKEYGKSIEIVEGDNIICFDGNSLVSRSRLENGMRVYGRVFFYETNKKFVFQRYPSEECSVNGHKVNKSVFLSAFDRISAGGTDLIFVPFIGEKFCWE